jgi:hypothetical protein
LLVFVAAFLGTTAITYGTPGAASAAKPQCNNRRDDDGDGKIDYPSDPGCSGRGDKSEVDPVQPPPPSPPPPPTADVVFDSKSDFNDPADPSDGMFNGAYITEIQTPYGPGFNMNVPASPSGGGPECSWDSTMKCVLGKWIYPSDFLGKTYDWTFYVNLPRAGNPQGIPASWSGGPSFEIGHFNFTPNGSNTHFAVDTASYPGQEIWRTGIFLVGVPPYDNYQYAWHGALQYDRWYKWRFVAKWSEGSDGFTRIYRDDVLINSLEARTMPAGEGLAMQVGWYGHDDNVKNNQIQYSTITADVTP